MSFKMHSKHSEQRKLSNNDSFNVIYVFSSFENQENDRKVKISTLMFSLICIFETVSVIKSTFLIIFFIFAIVIIFEFFSTFTFKQKSVVKRALSFMQIIALTLNQVEYTKKKRL